MMFVDADAVETELIGQFQLVEIAIIKWMAKLGIVQGVRTGHPGAVVRLRKILRQVRPGHQMKAENLHRILIQRFERLERFEP
jgi:hypothetical protein